MPFLQTAGEEVTTERDILGTIRHIFESKLFSIGKSDVTLLTIIQFIVFVVVFYFLSRLFRRFLKKRI
ncbi:TPA: hypothetical protein ENX78_19630, partial [Candidatus Poribacteria bacterium]|nr:hypothetical protein [Candidatus Poribacteria bacterium]